MKRNHLYIVFLSVTILFFIGCKEDKCHTKYLDGELSPIENDKTSYSFNLNLPGGVYSVVLEGTSGRLSKPLIIK